MQIDIKDLTNGKLDGQEVWVCHYNRPDLNKKPLRSVAPVKVLVRSNKELPDNKRIYYSESHFVVMGKDGKLTSKILPLYDNTGYRSYAGTPMYVFDDANECIESWNNQLQEHIARVEEMIQNAAAYWVSEREGLVERKMDKY